MAKVQSWLTKVVGWMKAQGFVPVVAQGGKSLVTRPCPNCGFKNAVVFKTEAQAGVFAVCCMKCKKKSVREKAGNNTAAAPTPASTEGLCKAVKADGAPCTNKAKENGYCGVHKNLGF